MRITPTLLTLTLPLAVACGGDSRDDDFGASGTWTTGDTAGETDGGGTTGDTGDSGDTNDTTDGGTTGDGGSTGGDDSGGSTGDPGGDPPAVCDFSQGCYDDTMTYDPKVLGANSFSPAGCEGEDFRITATFQIGGGGFGTGPEAHRAMPVLADFNNDGNLDVFMNPRKSGAFIVYGDGNGDFSYTQDNVVGLPMPFAFSSGWGADVGDIDGDGWLEPIVGDHGYDSAAWVNNKNDSFSLALEGLRGPSCSDPWSGSCSKNHNGGGLGDWSGDGNLDIILGGDQFNGTNVNLKVGDGNANWSDGVAPGFSGSTGYISAADIDNDGDLDAIGFSASSGASSLVAQVFKNNGGSFTSVGSLGNSGEAVGTADPRQGGVGDVNCDGFVDIAAGGTIYLNQGGNGFTKAVDVDGSQISHLADMNGDGHLDLITQDRLVGLALYYNDGTGMNWVRELDGLPDETYTQLGTTTLGTYGMDIGDIDNNGNLDIVRVVQYSDQWRFEAWTR